MKFYCDIDDVMCETASSLCVLAERVFGRHVSYAGVRDFNLQRVFNLTDDEMVHFRHLSHEPETLLSYPEVPGACEGVRSLLSEGHTVEFVTGRPTNTYEATYEWIRRAGFGALPVFFVNKYAIPDSYYDAYPDAPRALSVPELLSRSYDVAIDDSPVILSRLRIWSQTRIFVMNRPWNESFVLAPNMTRLQGWSDLPRLLAKGN